MQFIIESLAKLNDMYDSSLEEICDFALETGVQCTSSQIGYLAFLNEEQTILTMHAWSRSAMKQCEIGNKPLIYPVETTGLWGEAIRERKCLITNDYNAPSEFKKGCPEGHVLIKRHMNVPIFSRDCLLAENDKEKIVLLAGVGNKELPYDQIDCLKLKLIHEGLWRHMQRRDAKKKLESMINQRTEELQRINRQLTLSNEQLMQFAYVASHDLKAPLRAVYNLANWIVEDLEAGKDISQYVSLLKPRIKRMDALIEGLLEYSRVGRKDVSVEDVNVNLICHEIKVDIDDLENKIIFKDLPIVFANKTRIKQILANLIYNALKHHHDPINAEIIITGNKDGNKSTFCVQDNGPGIESRQHRRIFEMFQTLKSKDESEGAGMGLALVKRIAQEYEGDAWVESELGKGSKFYFTIKDKI